MNHVAIITSDTERLHAFYRDVFDATVSQDVTEQEGVRLSFVDVGPHTELNVFEIVDNTEASRQTPMFGRGRIDHLALQAASKEAFDTIRDRLIAARLHRRLRHQLRTDPQPLLPRSRRARSGGVRRQPRREAR